MARIIGKDTYLADQKFSNKVDGLFLTYLLFLAVISFWVYVFVFHFPVVGANVAGAILLLIFFILKKPVENKLWIMRKYAKGLYGEEDVREVLKSLPDSYTVFENVVIPPLKSNIDFVVVGANGIFTIEVKSHKGFMTDDGKQLLHDGIPFQETDVLHQAYGESLRLYDYLLSKNILPPVIQPLLVFSNKYVKVRFGKKPIRGVTVIGLRWLSELILGNLLKSSLSNEQQVIINKNLEKMCVTDRISGGKDI